MGYKSMFEKKKDVMEWSEKSLEARLVRRGERMG